MICKKEWRQFFSSLTGYIALVIFLLLNGLLFFVFPDTSLLDFGYATLDSFFRLSPWVLLFLVPTITMRSLADEYRAGTFELLKVMPVSAADIVWGKFLGALLVILLALIPTIIYGVSMQLLSAVGGIDVGSTIGSYIGLLLLGAVFTAAGICASSFTNNTVIAFITGAFVCFLLFFGFDGISKLPAIANNAGYYVEMLGLKMHYTSISKGVIDLRDILYFGGLIAIFLLITQRNILRR